MGDTCTPYLLPGSDRGDLRPYGLHESYVHPGCVLTGHCWYLHGLATLRHQGSCQLLPALHIMANADCMVGILGCRHTRRFLLGAAIKGMITDPFPFSPWYSVLPALATGLVIGPIEELGWRGVALPLLQRRLAPLWSSLILGGIWGLWHLPAFFLSGSPQSAWSFGPYFIGVLAITIILTPMFNAARGSLLIAALYHFQMNGPIWPDAQPWDILIFAVIAVVIVLLNRRTMLTCDGVVTDVLMPGQ